MEEIKIKNDKYKETLDVNFYDISKAGKLILIVGGSGDDKDALNGVIEHLLKKRTNYSIATFTPRGLKDRKLYALNQQTTDLKDAILYLIAYKNITEINLVATSMGAYSAVYILNDNKLKKYMAKCILVDPADYYLRDGDKPEENYAWAGFSVYDPNSETVSSILKNIDSRVKLDVIHFTVRNHGPNGYSPSEERGIDNKSLWPRLNTQMVKSFFSNTPMQNRGIYIEDNSIPHAFIRDGNVAENVEKVAELIIRCLS